MKTYSTKGSDIERKWHVIDASGKVLGKIASDTARLLMGKHKPMFTRNLDTGDYVVIVNAEKVVTTGNKDETKLYRRHSGYPGGFRETTLEKMRERHPERVIEHAVRGMLPQNRLGEQMRKKLRVYTGAAHPHAAQVLTTSATGEKEAAASGQAEKA